MTSAKISRPKRNREFFLVVRDPSTVQFGHSPQQALFDEADARAKAEGLARDTGHRFFLMRSVAVVEPTQPPVAWTTVE